ncbi:MAG: peptidase E [Candidatus Paceibacterota bacterium]
MKKIVAIGGGEIGSPGYPVETIAIDKEIIRLTGMKSPKVLFIPTASSDSTGYYDTVKKHYGKRLGCKTDVLWLIKEKLSRNEIKQKVMSSDIVYVGGGNTQKMIRVWKTHGLDKILWKAWAKGIILSGLSAGSICWFRNGTSDSRRFNNPDADLIKVSGLGFIPAAHSPHYYALLDCKANKNRPIKQADELGNDVQLYFEFGDATDVEKDRRPGLKKIMKKTSGVAIAIDNCCAVEFVDDTYRVISSKPGAKAYKVYWKTGKYHEEEIVKRKSFSSLRELLIK